MQANLIFQGSHDFYFPKYFGVIPNIARAVNSLVQLLSIGWGKKEKKIPFSNMNVTKKKKSLQGQISVHLVQQSVCKRSRRKRCVGRAISHICGLPPSSQHPAMGLGILAFGPADTFLHLQCLHSLLPKQVFHQLWCIFPISSSYKVQAHHKTHCIYLKSWPCASARNHTTEKQSDWTQTEFLQRTQVVAAELPYLPSYKQPGETRIAKFEHQMLLLKLPSRRAYRLYAS